MHGMKILRGDREQAGDAHPVCERGEPSSRAVAPCRSALHRKQTVTTGDDHHVRIEERKWDGTISTVVERAQLISGPPATMIWLVPAGTQRHRPTLHRTDHVIHDELWVSTPDEWSLLCAHADASGIVSLLLHAAAPFESTTPIVWFDLDLDLDMCGDDVVLRDEAEFHRHALTMEYPREVIPGAWGGICRLAPRYTLGEWPFDGSLNVIIDHAREASSWRH
jgi:hypothetical protein